MSPRRSAISAAAREIGLAGLDASVDGRPAPDMAFNQSVWDKWNAR